jgi:hypothetical protein
MMPLVNPSMLQFELIHAIPYQAKAFDADMRLALNTKDGRPKKDLLLELESTRIPVPFIPGQYSVDGAIIDDPITWACDLD